MNSPDVVPSTDLNELEHAVAEMCVRVPVSAGASGLAKELARIAPHLIFRDVLTRGGWYRLGGVIDDLGTHITDDLSLIHISEPTRRTPISYAVFCLKKKKTT